MKAQLHDGELDGTEIEIKDPPLELINIPIPSNPSNFLEYTKEFKIEHMWPSRQIFRLMGICKCCRTAHYKLLKIKSSKKLSK